jgi:hypothetical protein
MDSVSTTLFGGLSDVDVTAKDEVLISLKTQIES